MSVEPRDAAAPGLAGSLLQGSTASAAPALSLRLIGSLEVRRGGVPLALPPSRKVRALLAYLAMAGHATSRSHLCELLWDLPSDPRGELRWCLSKLRGVLGEADAARVVVQGDGVALDLRDCSVDAHELADALQGGIDRLPGESLGALAGRFAAGEFLDGLALPRSPVFSGWLLAQRRRFRSAQVALLEHWARSLPVVHDGLVPALERWIAIAPFDRRAHERLLEVLALTGRLREGEEHLAATARQYENEGQDWAPIGHAWRAAKLRQARGAPEARVAAPAAAGAARAVSVPDATVATQRRASLLVMPFVERTAGAAFRGGVGDGLAHDIITRLAKLRSMFVIAPGTVFALHESQVGPEDAGRRLDVDYVVSGSLRREAGGRLVVTVQLAETRTARVMWAEVFEGTPDDTFAVLDDIGNRIVTSIADRVERVERDRAILKPPNSLTAWEAHHRGLWHMVRFNPADNAQARGFFEAAVRLDPTFARPYAGLSFTHFQDAFLGWRPRDDAVEQAYRIASQALMADDEDPTAHWAMGRSLWLKGRHGDCLAELGAAVELSPNFALGHYTLGFVQAQSGDPESAIAAADRARSLSPFDPMLFAMLASRGLALMRLGRHDEAADWLVRAAARPNAHVHIQGIALCGLALAERHDEARRLALAIHQSQPGYGVEDLLRGFRFGPDGEALVRKAVTGWL